MARRSISPAPGAPIPAASSKPSGSPLSSHRPRKRFGQHFLHDPRILARIVEAVDPSRADFLVEIGPGEGALTRPLLERAGKLEAIELDRDLAARPPAQLPPYPLTQHSAHARELVFGRLPARARLGRHPSHHIST